MLIFHGWNIYQLWQVTSKIMILTFFSISKCYIMHKDIPVILLVNTTSRDIKYYTYILDIWREEKKLL